MPSTFNTVLYICKSQNDLKQSQRFNVHFKTGFEISDWSAHCDLEDQGQGIESSFHDSLSSVLLGSALLTNSIIFQNKADILWTRYVLLHKSKLFFHKDGMWLQCSKLLKISVWKLHLTAKAVCQLSNSNCFSHCKPQEISHMQNE